MQKIVLDILNFLYLVLKIIKSLFRGKLTSFDRIKRNRILIVGNGPSYKTYDFSSIDHMTDVLCVNFFPLKDSLFWDLKPKYLCLIDPVFFENQDAKMKDYNNILENIDWKMTIICPQGKRLKIRNNNIDYIFLNTLCYEHDILKYYFYEKNFANFGMHNVIHAALYTAINLNYKNIYLTGIDYSEIKGITVNKDNEIVLLSEHGYGTEYNNLTKNGYIKKGEFYMYWYYNYRGLKSFLEANNYAIHKKCLIHNLVPDSYIDAFLKIETDNISKLTC